MSAKEVIDRVLHSTVLTPRQRWIVVRRIKTGNLNEEELQKILRVMENEQHYLDPNAQESNEAYESRLKKWVSKLKRMNQTDFVQEVYEQEVSQAKEDEEAADLALNALKDL